MGLNSGVVADLLHTFEQIIYFSEDCCAHYIK